MAQKQSALEIAILAATKAKAQGPKEDRQEYIDRVATEFNSLDADSAAYKKLSKDVLGWWEKAVAASEADKAIPDFAPAPAAKLVIGKKAAATKPAAKSVPEPAKKKGGLVIGKKKEKVAVKKEKEAKQSRWGDAVKDKPGYRNMADGIRHIIIMSPKMGISFEDCKTKLIERGFEGNESRMYDNYIHATGTIKLLKETGKLS